MHLSTYQPSVNSTSECKRRRLDRDTLNSAGNSDTGSLSSGEMDTVDSLKSKPTEKPVQFSQQLIAFTLYGTQKHNIGKVHSGAYTCISVFLRTV